MRVQAALTERDLRLLGWLYDHGVLTTDQIAAALFPSLGFCQRRLLKLMNLGVLTRFRPQRWEGGSHPYHYVLDQLGTDVVAAQRGDEPPRRDQARRRRQHLTSRANLPHLLATNQFFVGLAAYERTHPGSHLVRWLPSAELDGGFFTHAVGNPNVFYRSPRPDGHGIWSEGERSVPFLLEMDLATESLTVLKDKIERYSRLTEHSKWRWPVLFWLPTARREPTCMRHSPTPESWFRSRPPPATMPPSPSSPPPTASGGCIAMAVYGCGSASCRTKMLRPPHSVQQRDDLEKLGVIPGKLTRGDAKLVPVVVAGT